MVPHLSKIKSVFIKLHTKEQLHKKYTVNWKDQSHFTTYLARRAEVHHLMETHYSTVLPSLFPCSHEIDIDIQSLDIDAPRRLISPYSEYITYLMRAGEQEALFTHVYSFYMAQLNGGGKHIASTAPLPSSFWTDSRYYAQRDTMDLQAFRDWLTDTTACWSPQQKLLSLREIPSTFDLTLGLHK
jgi:hypothetical protein